MSCDAELQELMIQVDRMVEEKKIEWEDRIKSTENKLQNTLHENYNMRSIIDERNAEIDSLNSKIRTRDSVPTMMEYDREMLQLRLELSQIKKSYEKYHYKYVKKAKEIEKEKEDLYKEKLELVKQINDYKNQQHHWNQERSKYAMQLSEVESRKQDALSDRTVFNEQLNKLKADYTHQLEKFAESEKSCIAKIRELENLLQESKNTLQREVEENRNKLCDIVQHTKRTLEEKQQVIIDNESAKRMIIRLENELGKVIADNKIKDKTIYKLEQTINMSEKTINEKNEIIKALQVNSSWKDYSSIISKLENELLEAKTSMKLTRKNEKSFQYEIQLLNKKLKEAQDLIEREQSNKSQIESIVNQVPKLEEDKNKLIIQVQKLEEFIQARTSEINDFKNQLELITAENEKLKQFVHQESHVVKRNGDNNKTTRESGSRIDRCVKQCNGQNVMYIMEKERCDLLKFCEDKDMVIQRLQMENRILQEFITKLNTGLTDETCYIPSETYFEDFGSASDVFQPLKETFTEYSDNNAHGLSKSSTRPLSDEVSSAREPLNLLTTKSNVYPSNTAVDNNQCRSSDEFLSQLSQKDVVSAIDHRDQASYLHLYPTLTAAKYFADERQKTKQIEQIIDLHMTQLRLETDQQKGCGV